MNISDEIQKIKSDFATKAERIRGDKNLTNDGKLAALQSLAGEKKSRVDSLVSDLHTQAVEHSTRAEKLRLAMRALTNVESEKFDYARLTYEVGAVKSALALAGDDAGKAAGMFADVKASGDSYKIKAWVENVPALVPTKPRDVAGWKSFIESVVKEKIQSAEMAGYENERREKLAQLESITRDVETIVRELATPMVAGGMDNAIAGYSSQDATEQKRELMARVFEGIEKVNE